MKRWRCTQCDWSGADSDVLTAPNPFTPLDLADTVSGCPECNAVNSMQSACDEPGCMEYSVCGTPTPSGYRLTCHDHAPK